MSKKPKLPQVVWADCDTYFMNMRNLVAVCYIIFYFLLVGCGSSEKRGVVLNTIFNQMILGMHLT